MAIVDCSGLVRDLGATTNPALRSLFAQGLVRIAFPDQLVWQVAG
ncbi:hypothetical protein [Bradyrhizobium sp.]|nr:hypothetical protein [Bradyrhizobium sp.]